MRNLNLCVAALSLLLPPIVCTSAWPREWTDATGKYTVEAEFAGVEDGKVLLRKLDGSTVSVPLEMLGKTDQQYVLSLTTDRPDQQTSPTPVDEEMKSLTVGDLVEQESREDERRRSSADIDELVQEAQRRFKQLGLPGTLAAEAEDAPDGNGDVVLIGADGPRRFQNPASDSEPSWSPDGTKILFVSYRNPPWPDLYVIDITTEEVTRLTSDSAEETSPQWSPDGGLILFQRDFFTYVMGADASDPGPLEFPGVQPQSLDWHPHGGRIALAAVREEDVAGLPPLDPKRLWSKIHVFDADDDSVTQLTEGAGIDDVPKYSPNGNEIAFLSNRHNPRDNLGALSLYVMGADGGNVKRLTKLEFCGGFSWSPDGHWIALSAGRGVDCSLYLVATDGSQQVRLTSPGLHFALPSWGTRQSSEERDATRPGGPIVLTNSAMLDTARQRIRDRSEPFFSAWEKMQADSEKYLAESPAPYEGTSHGEYFGAGIKQSVGARTLALVFLLSGDEPSLEAAKAAILAWARADGQYPFSFEEPNAAFGGVAGRVVGGFADTFALVHDEFTPGEREEVVQWLTRLGASIRASLELLVDEPGGKTFSRALTDNVVGLVAIGYATGDDRLVEYALGDPANRRNLKVLIDGALVSGVDELYRSDPTRTRNAPAPHAGEIFDRYGTKYKVGLRNCLEHLYYLVLAAQMARNNAYETDFFAYDGEGGESLEDALIFYSDFHRTGETSARTGYYAADKGVETRYFSAFELGRLAYPENQTLQRLLQECDRVTFDPQTFGWSAALTHGLDD